MASTKLRSELVPVESGFLASTGPVVITERSFSFADGATIDTAITAAEGLRRLRGVEWILGDLLLASEGMFKEEYEQIEAATGYDYQTLMNAKSLCRTFTADKRLWDLSPSFYSVVAPDAIEWADKKKYLDWAVKSGASRNDFRDYVREARAEVAKKDNAAANNTPAAADGATAGHGKPAAIKVEPSAKSLARVALDNLTHDERADLASLIMADTTNETAPLRDYDLTIADKFPVSMLLFAIERRVEKFATVPVDLLKSVKAACKAAERVENEGGDKAAVPVVKPAKTAKAPTAAKDGATPAPKTTGGKGKTKNKPAETPAPASDDAGDGLPVRDLTEDLTDAGDGDVAPSADNLSGEPNAAEVAAALAVADELAQAGGDDNQAPPADVTPEQYADVDNTAAVIAAFE